MPRQRLAPGEHGKITCTRRDGKHYATTYLRLHTGKRVEREAVGKSAEDARRNLVARITAELDNDGGALGRTTLDRLFQAWIAAKVSEDGIKPQSETSYRKAWELYGTKQIGSLRISELTTRVADAHLKTLTPAQSKMCKVVLTGMYGYAARMGAATVNPIRETRSPRALRSPTRAMTAIEFEQVRAAIRAYTTRPGPGPRRGRNLAAYVELLAATGCRPGEVLAIRWSDVDLLGSPPTATITGTLLDHGKVPGKGIHRQDSRKAGAPAHTVLLPRFGVEVLTALIADMVSVAPDAPVIASRDGGWMSPSNIASSLREALAPHEHLTWVTPHSLRRTVATVVRDELGVEAAQLQLSHSQMSTTEMHYLQRHTTGPDVREVLDRFVAQNPGKVRGFTDPD